MAAFERRKTKKSPPTMEIEDAFKRIGYFGRSQKKIVSMVFLYQIVGAFGVLSVTFIGLAPQWTCSSESLNNHSSSVLSEDKRCDYFEHNNCTPVYGKGFHSLTREWNLLCSQSHLISLTQSGFFLGFLVGSIIFGKLGDSIGRRKVTIMVIILGGVVSLLTALSPNMYLFALCRFSFGFIQAGTMPFYILASEIIGPSHRGFLSVGTSFIFALGFVLVSVCAYFIGEWRSLVVCGALLFLPFIAMYRSIFESPRWLLSVDRPVEARRVMLEMAKTNNTSLPSDFSLKSVVKDGSNSAGILDLIRHKILFKRTILMSVCWMNICMVYYGLSLGVGSLSNNVYISLSLSGIVEIPSYLMAYVMLDRLGRRWSNVLILLLGGGAALACAFVQFTKIDSSGDVNMVLALLGKFSISASFCVIYAYTPELYSTDVRNLGMAVCNMVARLGGIAAPIVLLLDETAAGLSMLVMGLLTICTGILAIGLPETLNAPLPNTVRDIT